MGIDAFHKFNNKYGLDSEIVASFCESFATHVDIPKEKWFKYLLRNVACNFKKKSYAHARFI